MNDFRFQSGVVGRGLTLRRRFLYFFRAIIEAPVLLSEIPAILGKRRTRGTILIRFMNDLCNATLGSGLDCGNKVISFLRRRQTYIFDHRQQQEELAASTLTAQQIDQLVEELNTDGFVRLPQYVSAEIAKRMRDRIEISPGTDASGKNYLNISDWVMKSSSGRFDTVNSAIIEAADNEDINFSALTLIARRYLGASPLLLGPHSWTTTHRTGETDLQIEENAMAYHCDSDFFGFLKVFLLLTDVSMKNGPFTFIRGSHRGKRHVQGRISNEMLKIQPNEELFGTGQPGDVILAATKGWHKATPPSEGTRTMVQWLYSNGLLGSATQ